MPVYRAEVIHKKLREDKEKLLDCLAGWILTHFNTRDERLDFLERMRQRRLGDNEIYKQQADDFIADLKKRILKIWKQAT